jgi:hypothetical protein
MVIQSVRNQAAAGNEGHCALSEVSPLITKGIVAN